VFAENAVVGEADAAKAESRLGRIPSSGWLTVIVRR
jgi:hypothetical protein